MPRYLAEKLDRADAGILDRLAEQIFRRSLAA